MPVECNVSTGNLSFGTVCVGAYSDLTFRITNTGDSGAGQLAGTVTVPGPNFTIQGTATYDLAPTEYQDFTVRFEPQSAGAKSETVDTGNALCTDVSVDGTGDDTAVCQVSPVTLNFGDRLVDSYTTLQFRITNTGCSQLNGTISSDSPHFIPVGQISYLLEHDEYRDMTIAFQPLSVGLKIGTIDTDTAICQNVSLSGSAKDVETTPYFQHDAGESTEITVYLRRAVVLPHSIAHELPTTISRTEDKKLKVYEHSLAGSKKRIWIVTAYLTNKDVEEYRWVDLEDFYWDIIHGAREQFTFRDNLNHTFTVRMVRFGPPRIEGIVGPLWKIRMILEEDYA